VEGERRTGDGTKPAEGKGAEEGAAAADFYGLWQKATYAEGGVVQDVPQEELQGLLKQLRKEALRARRAEEEVRDKRLLIKELSSEVSLLQESLAERLNMLNNSRQKEQMLEADLAQLVAQANLACEALNNMHELNEEHKLAASKAEAALTAETDAGQARESKLARQVKKYRGAAKLLEAKLESQVVRVAELEEALAGGGLVEDKTKSEAETVRPLGATQAAELLELRRVRNEQEVELSELHTRMSTVSKQVKKYRRAARDAAEELGAQEIKVGHLEAEGRRLMEKMRATEGAMARLQGEVLDKEACIRELEAELAALRALVDGDLELGDRAAREAEIADLRAAHNYQAAELVHLQSEMNSSVAWLERTAEELHRANGRLAQLQVRGAKTVLTFILVCVCVCVRVCVCVFRERYRLFDGWCGECDG
jgi:hypothetical protein